MSKDKKEKEVILINDKHTQKIIDKALASGWLLWITRHSWGNRKAVNKSLLKEKFQDDAKAISAAQKLIDPDKVKYVVSPITKAINMARSESLPWITDAVYFVVEKKILKIDTALREARKEVHTRRKEFAYEEYPKSKKIQKEKYPKLYNESYYPSSIEMESKFDIIWGWQKIRQPISNEGDTNILNIPQDIIDFENVKFRELIKKTAEETIAATRGAFLSIMMDMRKILKNPTKTFRNKSIEKPIQFLNSLKDINIYDDKPFMELGDKIIDTLKGISPDDLREDESYRKQMSKEVKSIIQEFENLPTIKFKRSLEF